MNLKISNEQKQKFIGLLADLLENGFSFKDSLQFMSKANLFSQALLSMFQQGLAAGYPISLSFKKCGYSSQQITQIRLAEIHGNLLATFRSMEKQMKLIEKQKKNLQKAVTYPGLLLIFLLGILLAMRQIVLPQLLAGDLLNEQHFGIQFLLKFPLLLFFSFLFILIMCLLLKLSFKKKKQLEKIVFLGNLPFFKALYRPYISGYFALEWGKLFQEGLELKQIIYCMKKANKQSMMKELAFEMEKSMKKGQPLVKELAKYSFFTKEFTIIIRQGEIKGKLGAELLIYSELIWERFFSRLEKMMTWIQPIIFLFVAILIVTMYAAILLPIYGNLEGVL